MAVYELIEPQSLRLTTLARVKAELRLTTPDADRDALINDLIDDASAALAKEIGYPLMRAQVRETSVGEGRSEILLSRTPIAKIDAVTIDGETVPPSGYSVDPPMGLMLAQDMWPNTHHVGAWITPYERPDLGRFEIETVYWAGALGPEDNVPASGMLVDAATDRFVFPDPPLVVAGDKITAVGFGQAANNGTFVVTARSETGITVDASLADETAPNNAELHVRTLDRALEKLCIDTVRAWFLGGTRDPNITSERIGDWSTSYAGNRQGDTAMHAIPATVMSALAKFRRYV